MLGNTSLQTSSPHACVRTAGHARAHTTVLTRVSLACAFCKQLIQGERDGMFPSRASFPADYHFGSDNVFGEQSSFGAGDTFGDNNVFGKGSTFGAGVSFGDKNVFGKKESFGPGSKFGSTRLSAGSAFQDGVCIPGRNCHWEGQSVWK